MNQIAEAMLRAGLITEEQLRQGEQDTREETIKKWREEYGSGLLSVMHFDIVFRRGGFEAVREELKAGRKMFFSYSLSKS